MAGSPSYVPCGPEWEKEVMKNPKTVIVAMLRNEILDKFMSKSFNVNHEVRVKLHEEGRQIYRKAFGISPKTELAEPITLQLWAFMSIFGPHLVPTMTPPFDPFIEMLPENAELTHPESKPY